MQWRVDMEFFSVLFVLLQLLKKSDRDDDVDSDRMKDKSDTGEADRGKWEKTGGQIKSKDPKDK